MNQSAGNVIREIRAYRSSLSPSERKFGDYIIDNSQAILKMTLSEVANEAGVSDATAVRFCRSLGYRRWLDFKIALTRSLPITSKIIHQEIEKDDSPIEVVKKVFSGSIQTLNDTLAVIDEKSILKTIHLIEKAKKILIAAVGTSSPMAQELYNRLFRLGLNCEIQTDSYLQVMRSALLTKDDVLFVISQTGASMDPIRTAQEAKKRGCPIICITGNKTSDLALLCDVVLLSVSHESMTETTSSRIAQYALIHSIYINLVLRNMNTAMENEKIIWEALISPNSFQQGSHHK